MSTRRRRFIPELILIGVVCALVARFAAPTEPEVALRKVDHPDPPPPPQTRSQWSVNRVTPGMTYEEVVSRLGLPSRIKDERYGWLSLHWDERNSVYFNRGIAYLCFGNRLYRNSKQLAASADNRKALQKQLGRGKESKRFASWWWPDSQIGITQDDRFLLAAPSFGEPQLSKESPWLYFFIKDRVPTFSLDGFTPGERPAPGKSSPQIQVSRSGFITDVVGSGLRLEAPTPKALSLETVFRSGEPSAGLGYWVPPDSPLEHFYSKDGTIEVESSQGKVTQFHLHLNQPELIEVLDRHAR